MFSVVVAWCNSVAEAWAWWMGGSILSAAVVLAAVSLLWLAVQRKASPQLGYLLFLLVPLKLFVPVEGAVPERLVSWAPALASPVLEPLSAAPVALPTEVAPPAPHDVAPRPAAGGPSAAPAPVRRAPRAETPPAPTEAEAPFRLSPVAWLFVAWVAGVVALLARLVLSQIRFVRVVLGRAVAVDPASLPVDFDALLARMGVRRSIRIVQSSEIPSPVVSGVLRPVVILPAGMAESLPAAQLEWILLHELAHVRR